YMAAENDAAGGVIARREVYCPSSRMSTGVDCLLNGPLRVLFPDPGGSVIFHIEGHLLRAQTSSDEGTRKEARYGQRNEPAGIFEIDHSITRKFRLSEKGRSIR